MKRMRILQVNTLDQAGGGGAAHVASSLYKAYKSLEHESYLAVGYKHDKESLEIPRYMPKKFFPRAWRALKNRTRRTENFDFPGTKKLLGLVPTINIPRYTQQVAHSGRTEMGVPQYTQQAEHSQPSHKASPFAKATKDRSAGTAGRTHRRKPDILHLHNLHGYYFDLRMLPYLSKQVPTILTLHDAWLLSGHCAHSFDCDRWKTGCGKCPDLTIYPALKQDTTKRNWKRKAKIYRQSKLYIATPCKWLMNKVEASMLAPGIVGKKVIPNGINLNVFKPGDKEKVRKKLDIPLGAFILLFVGHSTKSNPWKDYATLEKALKILGQKKLPKKIVLFCVGEESEPKKFGSAEICFVPHVKQETVASYFQAADTYVHPALAETAANVILEALSCGLPVIATNVGGISEQLTNKTGMLVKKKDALEFANAIESLAQNPTMVKEMSAHAHEDAQKRFSLEKQVTTYLDWYEEILQEKV